MQEHPRYPALTSHHLASGQTASRGASPNTPSTLSKLIDMALQYGRFDRRWAMKRQPIDKFQPDLPSVLDGDELSPYMYSSIRANEEIRLITLLPPKRQPHDSSSRELLRCTIETHALAQAPPYEALSYTWGLLHRHKPITVVGEDENGEGTEWAVMATPQVLAALRRLRGATTRRLWIDQLCINQDDVEEMPGQINLMEGIYRRASRVVIWLGEDVEYRGYERDETGRIREFVERDGEHLSSLIATLRGADEGNTRTSPEDWQIIARLVHFQLTYHYERIELRRMRAARDFLGRPWFERGWVFQEASLSKVLVMQLGRQEFPFDDLRRVFKAMHTAVIETGCRHSAECDLDVKTPGFELMEIIHHTRQEQADDRTRASGLLSKLFQILRRVQFTNPKDVIFAFLAFQKDEGIDPASGLYAEKVEDIWRFAANQIIRTTKSLDIFAGASFFCKRSDQSAPILPSWVPYWSDPFPFSRPIAQPDSRFNACRGFMHDWKSSSDKSRLLIKGKVIDHVGTILHRGMVMVRDNVALSTKFDLLVDGTVRYIGSNYLWKLGDYYRTKIQSVRKEMVRVILADGALGPRPLSSEKIERFIPLLSLSDNTTRELRRRKMQELSDEESERVADYEELEELALVMEQKAVFATPYLQYGMAPDCILEGDAIAIVHGSSTPCVLRRVEEGDVENEYRLVGQCYLNGWMKGQAPREVLGKDPLKDEGLEELRERFEWWKYEADEFVLI